MFLKDTWNIFESEIYLKIPRLFAHKVKINEKFYIKTEKLMITKMNKFDTYLVPIPTSHIGIKSIQCRLMSRKKRSGMVKQSFYKND